MGRLIAFSELREAVRVRYDLPTPFSNSPPTFVTLTAANSMINASLRAFYAMLMEAYGDNYFTTRTALATVAGTATTALPANNTKLIRLWWQRAADDVMQVRRGDADALRFASYTPHSWTECTPTYRLEGRLVRWLPPPSAVYTVHCDHVALPVDLVLDTDTFDAGPGWEEWVINDVCRKIAFKEEVNAADYQNERADWERRIRAQMPERDEADGLQLRDGWNDCGYERDESAWTRRDRLTLWGR